jgi:hypothetical protein
LPLLEASESAPSEKRKAADRPEVVVAVMEERKKGPGGINRLKRARRLRNRRLRWMKTMQIIVLLAVRYTHSELTPAAENFEGLERHPEETPEIFGVYDMSRN